MPVPSVREDSYLVFERLRVLSVLVVPPPPVLLPGQAVQTFVRQQTTHVAGQVGQTVLAVAAVELLLGHLARRAPGHVAPENRKFSRPLPLSVIVLEAGPRSNRPRAPATRVSTQITRILLPIFLPTATSHSSIVRSVNRYRSRTVRATGNTSRDF